MGEPKSRRNCDGEFKEGAIRLILDGGRTVRSAARDLGIHENMLHRWKKEYLEDREHAFPGKRHMKPHLLQGPVDVEIAAIHRSIWKIYYLYHYDVFSILFLIAKSC